MYKYTHFIPENTAPTGAKSIGVYDSDGNKVCNIPLGRMTPTAKEKLYSFGLVSDIHIYPVVAVEWTPEVKFDNALTYFESKNCAFCVQCGDFTQSGLYLNYGDTTIDLRQFEKYKEICDAHTIPVYDLCGNHESIQGIPITNNLTELKQYTGNDLYYSVSYGNDVFILLGQPNYNKVMSDDALQWLGETLEANKNKRCFVFIHPYIEEDSGDPLDFRENSVFVDWGTTKTNAFMNVMRNHENAILFHGHSHTKFECQQYDINANYTERNGFKSVHVPSLGKPRDINPETGATPEDNYASQGYIVDVYDDCVVLNGLDIVNSKYVPLGVYKIDCSSSTKYTNWAKYSCDVEIKTESIYTETSDGVGNITTDSLNWDDIIYRDHSFWEHSGFEGEGSRYQAGHADGTFTDWIVGYYIVHETEVYKITSLDSENGDVTCEIIATCVEEVVEETIYIQGSTSYGTIEANEGSLPESGTLIDGSVEDGYCVLDIDGVCYYYVVDTTGTPQPTTSNFTLSDESILITKDGKIFIAQ